MAGNIDVAFDNVGSIVPRVKSGEVRALAVMDEARSKFLPDVPTTKELGFPTVISNSTRGIAGPKGMPEPIVKKLREVLQEGHGQTPSTSRSSRTRASPSRSWSARSTRNTSPTRTPRPRNTPSGPRTARRSSGPRAGADGGATIAAVRSLAEADMSLRNRRVVRIGVVAAVCALACGIGSAAAEKSGGTLRIYNSTQPPSASIHEELTIATNMPFMAVFNNLVRFDATKPRNGFDTIVPELAESWAWDTTGTKLTFKLRSGRHLARRQALHGQGRAVHLASPQRQGARLSAGAIRARSGTRT